MDRPVLTLEEVNALVPALTELVGTQLKRRERIEELLTALALDTGQTRGDLTPRAGDSRDQRERKRFSSSSTRTSARGCASMRWAGC